MPMLSKKEEDHLYGYVRKVKDSKFRERLKQAVILADYKRLLDELANHYTYKGEPISSEGILERSNEVLDLFDRIQE